ncbi:MAG: preprotein translocase subunit SecG [Pyrinomonadaceae bacterium]
MVYLLYGIFFLSCLVLIAAVLLQPGKTDAGALFTSNVSSTAFSPRGTATVLSKVTIAAATTFMLSALFLAMPALTGNVSVLSSNPEGPADAPAITETNSVVPNDATNAAADNSNSSLIETPATNAAEQKAANASTGQANANAAAGNANR